MSDYVKVGDRARVCILITVIGDVDEDNVEITDDDGVTYCVPVGDLTLEKI